MASIETKEYNICYIFTGGFEKIATISIFSLCKNNKHKFHFFLLTQDVKKKDTEFLKKLIIDEGHSVKFIDINDTLRKIYINPNANKWPKVVFARLLLSDLLPNRIKKILYLDGDTIIRGDIKELYEMDLANNVIGMSVEPTKDKQSLNDLGLGINPYYNSGVILFDLEKWRQGCFGQKCMDYFYANWQNLDYYDQDVLSIVMKGKIATIEPRYNFSDYYYIYPYRVIKNYFLPSLYFNKTIFEKSKKHPIIVHFIGKYTKPWTSSNSRPFIKEFYDYANQLDIVIPKQKNWRIYSACWFLFDLLFLPFPMLRLKTINGISRIKLRRKKTSVRESNASHTK